MSLIERVESNFSRHAALKRGQRLAVAVSGGVDSMVLLALLNHLAKKHHWRLLVLHFNHRLRGRSSDADERCVRKFTERLKLPFVSEQGAVKQRAKAQGISLEMAARELRHAFLAATCLRHRTRTLALAHHADDQVELFFLRLLRGAGTEGLSGMAWQAPSPVSAHVRLIRPLLNLPKAELEQYARAEKIPFREDQSNACLDMERNRIRHELLPLLRRKFSGSVDRAVRRTMEILAAEADYVEQAAAAWLEAGKKEAFAALHPAVQRRVLRRQLFQLGIVPDFERVERLRLNVDKPVSVAAGRVAGRDRKGAVWVQAVEQEVKFSEPDERTVRMNRTRGRCEFGGCEIAWSIQRAGIMDMVRRSEAGREVFDADRIGDTFCLRHWRPGDRFQPIGLKHTVKLQDWFVNQKIPEARRHRLLLATGADGEIFWVEGMRISERSKVSEATQRWLTWRWRRLDRKPPKTTWQKVCLAELRRPCF